ncbi:MAG: ATP-binding protein [Candidatus Poseidoniaceae archaeon]|nr:ATP-binding protein [Candidatus Poseidoniaceae archaeon]
MEVQGKEIELPPLASNPFSTLPLESSQNHLLVGRVHVRDAMAQYIQFKSPRRILLSGEMGSGRSSLLRCLSNHAPKSVHIDHISQKDSALCLMRDIYAQLTGTEAPIGWSQVAEKLVEASNVHLQSLPLIVIDAQHVEMTLLSDALRAASATLNRVRCVLVVVIETMQKAQFPEQLLHIFDSDFYLEPLTINEVQALVERRVQSVSKKPFTLSFEDARHLREKSGGNPASLIRLMRNAVDASRDPNSLAANNQILSMPEPDLQINSMASKEVEVEPFAELGEEEDEANPVMDSMFNIFESPSEEASEEPLDQDYIDASTPWTERKALRDEEDDVKIIDNVLGFDLNLEQLDEEKSADADLPELPYKALPQTPEFVAAAEDRQPTVVNGAFSGLVGRLRDGKGAPEPEEQTGAELWLSEGTDSLPSLPSTPMDEENEDSATLIHDEVGLFEPEFVPEAEEDSHLLPELTIPLDNPPVVTTERPNHDVDALATVLQNFLMAMSTGSEPSQVDGSQRAFIDALAGLQHRPSKDLEEYILDVTLLSNLNANEMAVLAVAQQRKFSPSDKELLADLRVKRSRLSQICSRLLKGGVLNARTSGRQRFYTMTPTARAQLEAWGVQGGEA